jgi:hypothetical protein
MSPATDKLLPHQRVAELEALPVPSGHVAGRGSHRGMFFVEVLLTDLCVSDPLLVVIVRSGLITQMNQTPHCWIRIQWGPWIRIQGGAKIFTKIEKSSEILCFEVLDVFF